MKISISNKITGNKVIILGHYSLNPAKFQCLGKQADLKVLCINFPNLGNLPPQILGKYPYIVIKKAMTANFSEG